MIALLGSLLGFIGALVPEFFKIYTAKQDRAHELKLLEMQMEQQRQGHSHRLEEIGIQADIAESQALYKTYKTGVTWVDALNGTVRPVLAYAFFGLYATVKVMQYTAMPDNAPLSFYLDVLWNVEDQALFAGIMSFYFGARSMQKLRKG